MSPVVTVISTSPRRKELMAEMGIPCQFVPSEGDEIWNSALAPIEQVKAIARSKLAAVAHRYPADVCIAADTAVAANGEIWGKPIDVEDAVRMLTQLSGGSCTVITALAIQFVPESFHYIQACETIVRFNPLAEAEIRAYVATGEPLDKAGAFAIQGQGGALIAGIEGDYSNVVGLPMPMLRDVLRRWYPELLIPVREL